MKRHPDDTIPDDRSHDCMADEEQHRPGDATLQSTPGRPREIGGRKGPEPTRFGDWEKDGRGIDF